MGNKTKNIPKNIIDEKIKELKNNKKFKILMLSAGENGYFNFKKIIKKKKI
jgi:hypothetical protein